MNAVDTNVLLYSIDKNEPIKQLKAQVMLQTLRAAPEPTVMPWQVLGELGQQLRRWRDQGKISRPEYDLHIQVFRQLLPLTLPTPKVFDMALDFADRYSLSHWDSMLLGACNAGGVTRLFTEDMGAPRTIDGIQLVNPLV